MSLINFGLEAIDFQSSEFAELIEKQFIKLLENKNGKEAEKSDEAKEIVKLLKSKTNIPFEIKYATSSPPCVLPIHVNGDSLLAGSLPSAYYNRYVKSIFEDIQKTSDTYVDLKNAKVGGIFAKQKVTIWMSFAFLKAFKFTPREITAILMHEVGHAFVAYELAFNTIRTNQILLALHKSMLEKDQKVFHYALGEVDKIFGPRSQIYAELKEEKDEKVVLTLVAAKAKEKRLSELGTHGYDQNTFEALADNFATRMGLGRDLITGLDKLHRAYGLPDVNPFTRAAMYFTESARIAFMILGLTIAPPAFAALALIFLIHVWVSSEDHDFNNVYDKVKVRYKRVREQMIEQLKSKDLEPEEVKRILGDIKVVDTLIDKVVVHRGIYTLIAFVVFPSNWGHLSRVTIQRKLEELANNELFIKAAELRGMN